MHYWHMWEYTSDHEQVTAEMNTDQTFEHLLVNGCFNNLAIVSSGHDYVSACFEDTVMRIGSDSEIWPQTRFMRSKINMGDLNAVWVFLGSSAMIHIFCQYLGFMKKANVNAGT